MAATTFASKSALLFGKKKPKKMGLEPQLSSVGEQERLLDAASKVVKAEAFEMKRCLDKSKTMDALKHSINFLNELRTNDLSPKFYYRLYMDCTNELQHLEAFLVDEYARDKTKIGNLYECVQYASSIVPRLYLLVTVGVVYLKCGEGSRSEILSDIVAMCRGVQHPLRGLFLRNYLLQSTRSLLPDVPKHAISASLLDKEEVTNGDGKNGDSHADSGDKPSNDGTVTDAITFILENFGEMNKLWVRMQHQGPSKEREKRERERMELRILVGTNLVRLSQLESLTEEIYVQDVLPKILEQIVSCHDAISQGYLMECVIQVFADDYHLATLNEFLFACGELVPEVNVKDILIALIDRLALYSANEGKGKPKQAELFGIFSEQAKQLIENRPQMPVEDIVSLHAALISLAIKCYPDNVDYASVCFQSLKDIFSNKQVKNVGAFGPVGKELTKLLHLPIDEYKNVLRLQEIKEYNAALDAFDYRGRCNLAAYIIQSMLENETLMTSEDELTIVFELLDALLVDQPDQPPNIQETEDFVDEQQLVARLVHLIRAPTPEEQFLLLNNTRKVLGAGGKHRISLTLPSIIFELYHLLRIFAEDKETENWNAKVRKMFMCAMGTIGALITTAELAELPLKLYLEGAVVADKISFEENHTVVYEFVSKALSVLEDEIVESRDRIRCIYLITGTLQNIHHLPDEAWQPLASQVVLAAAKLFKKPDQVRSLCCVANLYWTGCTQESGEEPMRNGKKVGDILKKGVKSASECLEPLVQQQLFILLLNTYAYYIEEGCKEIDLSQVKELLSRTRDNAVQLDVSAEADALDRQLADTTALLQRLHV